MVRWVRWRCPPDTGFKIYLSPGGLRPSTLPLGHGDTSKYWVLRGDGEEIFFFLSNHRDRKENPELVKGSGATNYPRTPPFRLRPNQNSLFRIRNEQLILHVRKSSPCLRKCYLQRTVCTSNHMTYDTLCQSSPRFTHSVFLFEECIMVKIVQSMLLDWTFLLLIKLKDQYVNLYFSSWGFPVKNPSNWLSAGQSSLTHCSSPVTHISVTIVMLVLLRAFMWDFLQSVTLKYDLRCGSSRHGKVLRESVDSSWVSTAYLEQPHVNIMVSIMLSIIRNFI